MKFTRRAASLTVGLGVAAMLATTGTLAATGALAAPSAPRAAQCSPSHLTLWTGQPGDAAAGHAFFQVELSNTGHSACSLFGYPGVSLLNGSGHQVGLPAGHSGAKATVVIPGGGTAHFVLTVTDPGIVCAHPVKGSVLKVFAPGAFHANQTEFSASVCPNKVTLHVDAIHAGTGIPGFSTS